MSNPSINSKLTHNKVSSSESITNNNVSYFSWSFIRKIAFEHKRQLIIAHVMALFAVVASVPIPLLMPLLVDEVLLEKPAAWVAFLSGLFPVEWHGASLFVIATLVLTVLLRVSGLLLNVWQLREFSLIAKDVTYRIRKQLLTKLNKVSMAEYETLGSGTVSSHFITDINAIDDFIGEAVSKALVAALTLVGVTAVLLWIHWQLALFILVMNPLVIYFTVVLGKQVKHLKKKENYAYEIFQQAISETLDAIHQLRASNREKYYLNDVINKARAIKKHSATFSWRSDAANRFSFGVFLLGFDVFRAITMLMVVFSDLSVGQMIAVFGYLWFMMAPVQELLHIQYAFYAAKAALARVNRLATLSEEPQYPHLKNPFKEQDTVSLKIENLSFAYQIDGQNVNDDLVLKSVNLNIKKGEKIALVGASGGGKSTLVQIILGMYPPQTGQLYFDNVPVSQIGLDVVRENVATVLQHPALFNDSVRMNLSLGENYADEQLWNALEIAQLKATIEELPDALDTIVGRQGVRLSGGQRQRLAIARMILSQPKLVILDEATSALDTQTESKLHHAMNDFFSGRTTLIIAHRLSAVKQADRIYVFDGGEVIEEGAHEDLIEQKGFYNRLYGKR